MSAPARRLSQKGQTHSEAARAQSQKVDRPNILSAVIQDPAELEQSSAEQASETAFETLEGALSFLG